MVFGRQITQALSQGARGIGVPHRISIDIPADFEVHERALNSLQNKFKGSGSLKALVTLLVIAISAQMTLRGLFAEGRTRFLDYAALQLAGPQDLGYLLSVLGGLSAAQWRGVVLALVVVVAAVLLWRNRAQMDPGHWLGGVAVGLLVPAAWVLTGLVGYLPEHPDTLEPAWLGTATKRPEAMSFTAPVAHTLDLLTLDRKSVV